MTPVAARKSSVKKSARKRLLPAVTLTHPERVVFDAGYTKQDVADYYRAVMPALLDGIRDRPLSIVRCPDGANGGCFFQKHTLPGLKCVGNITLKEENGSSDAYLFVRDAEEVIELVQFNAIEFHPWATTIKNTDVTDYLVFDLDPGRDIEWTKVKRAAQRSREEFEGLGLRSFVRTSGGKGLHVVIPLRPAVRWTAAKAFAHDIATRLTSERPDEFIDTASKAKRAGVIFIDYLRNSRGATSVASYSLRSRAGAPVACPLRWEELRTLNSASAFTLANVPARLKRQRGDPWAEFGTLRQSLPKLSKATR